MLIVLFVQSIFFVELYSSEARKLGERLINYVIYKVKLFKLSQRYEVNLSIFAFSFSFVPLLKLSQRYEVSLCTFAHGFSFVSRTTLS